MQKISFPKYGEYLKRVIDWNAVVGQYDIELQRSLILSEIKETKDALADRDHKEIVDGVCDVFVTASYMNYLYTGNVDPVIVEANADYAFEPNYVLDVITAFTNNSIPHHNEIQSLILAAVGRYGLDKVEDYMERVLDSNDSKFVPADQWDEEREINHAYNKYGFEFGKIGVVARELNGKTVYLLRGNDGEGKLLKPTTFVEP